MTTAIEGTSGNSLAHPSEKVAICISVSSDLAFAAGVTLINFIEIHGTEGFHFRIFSDSKLPRMVKIFMKLGADFEVEVYKPPVNWTKLWGSKAIAYFTPLVLAKFEGFRLLSEFSTVVWLDYDILITKSISELWDKSNFDMAFSGSSQMITKGFTDPPDGRDLNSEGMSAGILAFRRSFPSWNSATLELYELFTEYYSKLYYPEQAVFDIFLSTHPGFAHWQLDEKFGAYPGQESSTNAILHAYGSQKFWSGLHNEFWQNYYLDWLSRGGSSWRPINSKLKKTLRGIRFLLARLVINMHIDRALKL
jgi:lipopolysaccharide biosynthesis glycosyltransferase